MQGSGAILLKNLKNVIPGLVAIGAQAPKHFATWKKMADRKYKHAPEAVVDQVEQYEVHLPKRQLTEADFWIDTELSSEVSQKDLAEYITYKQDLWKSVHCTVPAFLFGGYAVFGWAFWLQNNTWVPSTFNSTAEEKAAWREAQDMYRYKYTPALIAEVKWMHDFHMVPANDTESRGWDELLERNNIRRDPKIARAAEPMLARKLTMVNMWRKKIRTHARAMGIPTWPGGSRTCLMTRLRDYWNLIWNEDYMTIKGNLLANMSDEDLQDFAWRRFLSPYDKKLSREQVLQRINDYHGFLGEQFVAHQTTPNLHAVACWCLGHYYDPAYLVEDIAELDKNDFDHLKSWGKDAFLRRLEFENGPLRDQVEAHTTKLLAARKEVAAQ